MYPINLGSRRTIPMKRRKMNRTLIYLRNILALAIIMFILFICKVNKLHESAVLKNLSRNTHKFVFWEPEQHSKALNANLIEVLTHQHNSVENILNVDAYGVLKRQSVILVILVDKYSSSLKYLLASLSQLEGIEDALLIFSHSYFDEDVNNIIGQVDYSRVLQIFYPYSIQLHPQEFPGYDASDCPHEMDIKTAESLNCTGAGSPDIHGHYRNPVFAAQKHHWWWTANKIFENLTCTAHHNGLVIFLEQDLFFMDDFIYMALQMKNIADTLSQCEFISLGTRSIKNVNIINTYRIEVTTWDYKVHSSVLGFDFKVWNSIVSHYDLFCLIDDYSWARSLYYISLNRRDGKRFKVIHGVTPRAFKVSTTAISTTFNDIEIVENIYQVMILRKKYFDDWFPIHLEVYYNIELEKDDYMIFEYAENNGGWNDPRDKAMCKNMTIRKIRKVLMDMKNEFKDYISEKYP